MANGTNVINIVNNVTPTIVNVMPAPLPPPTPLPSTTQTSPSPSASGPSRSTSPQILEWKGFWAFLSVAFVAVCALVAFYIWRRTASKRQDPESIPLQDAVPEQQPGTNQVENSTGEDVTVRQPLAIIVPPATPTKKKTQVKSGTVANFNTIARNSGHWIKSDYSDPPQEAAISSLC